MLTNGLTIGGALTMFPPAIPPRSRLFHLEPVGVGTPYVESLSGYAARLAAKHSTTLYYLFSTEIASLIDKPGTISRRVSFASFAKAVNGLGVIAADLVEVLERLTLRCDLRLTTMLPWAGVISVKGLIRRERAWCPACYDECVANGVELYDQLIWAIQSVTACTKHKQPLNLICPLCGRGQRLLSHDLRPGFCARCQSWLGGRICSVSESRKTGHGNATQKELTLAEGVGTLLAAAELPPPKVAALLIANLRRRVDKMFMGRGVRSQLSLPADNQTVRCWLSGVQTPSLPLLLETCSALGITPVDLLRDESDNSVGSPHVATREEATADGRTVPSEVTKVDWRDAESVAPVEQRLRAALEAEPPISLTQVAKEFNCTRGTLRKKFPNLAACVAAKAVAFYRPTISAGRVAEMLRAALVETPPPSLKEVSRRLGAGASAVILHKRFPEESRKIVERYSAYKKRRFNDDKLEKKLRAALKKMPPPSMVAVSRNLGVAKATLYSKFPELCNALSSRFAAYRRERDACNRAIAKAEIRAICERALQAGVYPSFALVRGQLPVPCQSEAFSKIRREALAELGCAEHPDASIAGRLAKPLAVHDV
jgi:hypothetical protein